MNETSLFIFVPTLFAMLCLFTRRNFFCMYMALMVWLQSVVVTASWRPFFDPSERNQITFVCLLITILCFAAVLRFSMTKNTGGRS